MATIDITQLRRTVGRRIETMPAELLPEVAELLDRLQGERNEKHATVSMAEAPGEDGKLEGENAAFSRMRDHLAEQFPGEYVAIHEGLLIDHDPDLRSLYLRVYSVPGRTQVLMKRVTDESEPELLLRSPWRLEPLER